MSLVTALRDYSEHLTTTSLHLADKQNLAGVVQATAASVVQTLRYLACYVVTFQWFRDVTYLPLRVPELSLSLLNERLYPLDGGSSLNLLTILEPAVAGSNKLLVGLVNSCFASLPLSCAHLLLLRRLLVEGVPAGVASGFGTVVGQCCLLTCVLCGLRGLVVPWLSLEPLNYLAGTCLLVTVIYRMAHEQGMRLVGWGQRGKLLAIFSTNLMLTLFEQTSLLAHLSNISLAAEPSYLEGFPSTGGIEGLVAHGSYLLSFFAGSLLFTGLFSGLLLLLKQALLQRWRISNTRILRGLNKGFQVLILAFSFASVPYYGVDYTLFKGVGFLPEDRALRGTVVYPYTLKRPGQMMGHVSAGTSFDIDVVPFDRGWYGNPARRYAWSYEELNYQGEMSWLRRIERLPNIQKRRLSRGWREWVRKHFYTSESSPIQKSLRDEWVRKKKKRSGSKMLALILDAREYRLGEEMRRRGGKTSNELWSGAPTGSPPAFLKRDFQEKRSVFLLYRTVSSGLSSPLYKRGFKVRLLEKRFKRRFYNNGVYRLLLRADIDNFLGRQPSHHLLSPNQEKGLFQDRQALSRYYNSLREYRKMDQYEPLQTITLGSRSYTDRAYNQQFKGTVKVVRKLFSVTTDPFRNPLRRRVVKYDQPLPCGGGNPIQHEEGGGVGSQHLSWQGWDQGVEASPFVEETDPKPLFAGWDEQLRKMVVTNRFLPRTVSPYEWREGVSWPRGGGGTPPQGGRGGVESPLTGGERSSIRSAPFTAWPIPKERLDWTERNGEERAEERRRVPYETVVSWKHDPSKGAVRRRIGQFRVAQEMDMTLSPWTLDTWPENLKVYYAFRRVFPPTWGGFVWPGNQMLEVDIKRLLGITTG